MSLDAERAEIARIMVGHCNTFSIHSGNIINWNMLKKHRFHTSMTSSDELMDALHSAIQSWIRGIAIDPVNMPEPQNAINISNRELETPIDPDQREKLKLSVKLFLCDWRPNIIRRAVDKVIQNLDVQRIDSLIVSFPVMPPSTNTILENSNISPVAADLNKIKPIWKEMQSVVDSGHVSKIGVSDFDQAGLELLHNWARIKPSINQISLNNCCAVPTDLIQYSREEKVELLTHSDPPEILSARNFQSFMSESTQDIDATNWTPSFIARYSVLVRNRGIVHSKGYITSAERQSLTSNGEDYGFF
ncbi:glutamate--cysteine ligase regulatory subunit-like [Clavelina lepadiformis]|uniref:glutamate--cysteine ligase regulatory subunit-like n=1 Tax=Clavelina lepadiformis TaxID=159417 RepID=UPI004041C429